jgi:hypothetical protein
MSHCSEGPTLILWNLTNSPSTLFPCHAGTLADMAYDVYHGTIDSEGAEASQLFYVRPR